MLTIEAPGYLTTRVTLSVVRDAAHALGLIALADAPEDIRRGIVLVRSFISSYYMLGVQPGVSVSVEQGEQTRNAETTYAGWAVFTGFESGPFSVWGTMGLVQCSQWTGSPLPGDLPLGAEPGVVAEVHVLCNTDTAG
jgi:hypothetical protein